MRRKIRLQRISPLVYYWDFDLAIWRFNMTDLLLDCSVFVRCMTNTPGDCPVADNDLCMFPLSHLASSLVRLWTAIPNTTVPYLKFLASWQVRCYESKAGEKSRSDKREGVVLELDRRILAEGGTRGGVERGVYITVGARL